MHDKAQPPISDDSVRKSEFAAFTEREVVTSFKLLVKLLV
jgi:hypothetical protein